ncbi:MAG: Chromosome segregation ATPase-like protein [Candidatus Dependentiae bacterium]|nr:Chromosome segregation ATPase-like protein [Candidatus Dependentiae bacterium]
MNHTPTGSPNNGAPRTIIVVFTCLSLLLFATTHPTTTPAPAVAPVTPASTTDAAPKSAEPATEKVATDNADTSDGTNPPSDAQAEMAMVDGTDPNEKPVSYMATAHTDNVAAFDPSESDNAIVPAVALPAPEPDTGPAPITAEESAAKVEAAKAEKKTILAAAQKNETEKTTAVKKDTDLFAYNLTGLKEAGVDISKNGFGMTAKMSLGWGAYLRATFAVNTEGLLLQAYMKEINVANLIKITGVGPDGKYGTADDGVLAEIRLDKKVQKVTLSGLVDLFGAMAEIDLIIASETIHLMTYANLFGMFSTTFLAEFKLNDGDFFLEGAVENNFIGFIEKEAKAAVTKVGDALVNVYKKAEKGIENARKKVDGLKHDISNLSAKLKHAQAAYFAAMNGAQKGIDSAVKAVEEADRNLGHELGKILAARKKMLEGRKKIAAAVTKVNSLNSEVHHAIASLKRVARGMKWYEFWKVAELTYWSVRVAAVETARGVAIGVLETVKALVLPLSEILTVTYALSYAAGEVALKASYVGLEAALVAANPLTIEELAEVLAFSLALNTTNLS